MFKIISQIKGERIEIIYDEDIFVLHDIAVWLVNVFKKADALLTEPPPAGTETILVAEDDDDVRAVIQTILEGAGYSVITASDGVEAVKRFKTAMGSIRLVVMDVIMPRKNGKEAYDEITGIAPGTPVIFTSGYNEDIINNGVIFDEGLDFISKPLTSGILLRKVREVLDR